MKLDQVRTIAKSHGIQPGKLTRAELIRSIQSSEGNPVCFSSATDGECDQTGCLWREDCITLAQTAHVM